MNENKKYKLNIAKQATKIDIIVWAILGALSFLIIYGIRPLIVTDDRWILNSYVEADIIQHYSGWMAFRDSDWLFPLGQFDAMAGGILTYTDALPWVSIFLKLFRGILPETFQFFGLYIFLCFILQAIAAGKLLKLFINDKIGVALGVMFFCFSPIMMERAFRHTALASHYLIIFCLYLLFKSYYTKKMDLWYILLAVIAIGIHPYLLPIVFSIIGMNVLYLIPYGKKTFIYDCGVALLALILTVLAGVLIGALGGNSLGNNALGADAYGYFSMNLNALYNPFSCGAIKWSHLIPVSPWILGNYDGFNYLGLGILLGLPLCVYYFGRQAKEFLKKNWSIIAVSLFMTVFALSNTVTFNDAIIFEYPLPEKIYAFASIFRASSRMFYPVYYLIMLGVVVALYRLNTKKIILVALLMTQLLDMTPAIKEKQDSFSGAEIETSYESNSWYNNVQLDNLSKAVDTIYPLENIWDFYLAAWGLKNDVQINVSFASSIYSGGEDDSSENLKKLVQGELAEGTAFVTAQKNLVDDLVIKMPEEYNVYCMNNYYFIVNKNVDLGGEKYVADIPGYSIYDVTYENWTNGVLNGTDNTFLFAYSIFKENELKDASFLVVNNKRYEIVSYESFNNQLIQVVVDNPEHDRIAFPDIITFE